jgi:hypothetical protein
LFAANGKWKQQTPVCFLQMETEVVFFTWSANDKLNECFYSKSAYLWQTNNIRQSYKPPGFLKFSVALQFENWNKD